MNLRNKETGQVFETIQPVLGGDGMSIAELNEKWEDVLEEPRWNWYIDWDGEIKQCDNRVDALLKFETREEAEKAVEKLKAWKRLKDKGFRFDGYDSGHNYNKELCGQAYFKAGNFWFDITHDLDLLFGGEE